MNYLKAICITLQLLLFVSACATTKINLISTTVIKQSCDIAHEFRSEQSEQQITVGFRNSRLQPVHIFWINFEGQEEPETVLQPGENWYVDTFISHPWSIRTAEGECIAVYNSEIPSVVTIQ